MKIISLFSIFFFPILIDALGDGCTLNQLETLTEGRNLIINEVTSNKEYNLSCPENHSFRENAISANLAYCNFENQWSLISQYAGSKLLSEKDADDDVDDLTCIANNFQQKCNRSMIDSSIQLSKEEYFEKEEIAITCPTNMHFNDQNTSDTLKLICEPTGWHEKITNALIVDKLECAFCNEEKLFLLTKPKHLVVEFSGNDRNIYQLKCKEDYAFDDLNVDLIAKCSNGEWTIDWKGGTEKSCNREFCDSVELKGEVPLKREVKMTLQVGSKNFDFL